MKWNGVEDLALFSKWSVVQLRFVDVEGVAEQYVSDMSMLENVIGRNLGCIPR